MASVRKKSSCNYGNVNQKTKIILFMMILGTTLLCTTEAKSSYSVSDHIRIMLKHEMKELRKDLNLGIAKAKIAIQTEMSKQIRSVGVRQHVHRFRKERSFYRNEERVERLVTALGSKFDITDNKLDTLKTEIYDFKTVLELVESKINLVNRTNSDMCSGLVSVHQRFDSVYESLENDVGSKLKKIDININSIQNKSSILESQFNYVNSKIDKLILATNLSNNFAKGVKEVNDKITIIERKIIFVTDKTDSIDLRTASTLKQIENVGERISSFQTNFVSLDTSINSINHKIGSVETSISSANFKTTNLVVDINNINNKIENLETSFTSTNYKLGSIENSISSVNYKVILLDSNVSFMKSNLDYMKTYDMQSINNSLDKLKDKVEYISTNDFLLFDKKLDQLALNITLMSNSMKDNNINMSLIANKIFDLESVAKITGNLVNKTLVQGASHIEQFKDLENCMNIINASIHKHEEYNNRLTTINNTLENIKDFLRKSENNIETIKSKSALIQSDLVNFNTQLISITGNLRSLLISLVKIDGKMGNIENMFTLVERSSISINSTVHHIVNYVNIIYNQTERISCSIVHLNNSIGFLLEQNFNIITQAENNDINNLILASSVQNNSIHLLSMKQNIVDFKYDIGAMVDSFGQHNQELVSVKELLEHNLRFMTFTNTTLEHLLSNFGCRGGFLVNDQCFRIFTATRRNWDEANSFCTTQGLRMAEPSDLVALRRYIVQENLVDFDVWIGARGNGSQILWTSTGFPLPADKHTWFPGQPGKLITIHYCTVLMTYQQKMESNPEQPLYSIPCSVNRYTLCQV